MDLNRITVNPAQCGESVMERDEVLGKLRGYKLAFAEKHRISRIGVFGSFARGDARQDSDVDIVFESDTPNLLRTAQMREELEALLARHVDIVRMREGMDPRLQKVIRSEARFV